MTKLKRYFGRKLPTMQLIFIGVLIGITVAVVWLGLLVLAIWILA